MVDKNNPNLTISWRFDNRLILNGYVGLDPKFYTFITNLNIKFEYISSKDEIDKLNTVLTELYSVNQKITNLTIDFSSFSVDIYFNRYSLTKDLLIKILETIPSITNLKII